MEARTKPNGVITLLTDFGSKDPFVGVIKGVILARFPQARVVDLCNGIEPQAIVEGAFWLDKSFGWFAPGTIHVAVVDPGVGSARGALAVYAEDQYFLGPDNGLLSGPLSRPHAEVRAIDVGRLALPVPSRTFHGRDVFAPIAAELAAGHLAFSAVGPECAAPIADLLPSCSVQADCVEGAVVAVDRYGNLITNIGAECVSALAGARVELGDTTWPICGTYAEIAPGGLAGVINAFSCLELAMRDGSAAARLGAGPGTPVRVARRGS